MTDFSISSPAPSREGWIAPAISWSAVFAGGFAAIGLSVVLIILGSAFGFGAMSPFAGDGLSAATIGIVTIVWLIFIQLFASIAGGYIAGRVRPRWTIHGDEVYFRDTVHGFLTWAVASAAMFAVAALAAGVGTVAAAGAASAIASTEEADDLPAILIADHLYRVPGVPAQALSSSREEASRLILQSIADEDAITPEDRAWLVRDVADRTDIPVTEADTRVQLAFAQIEQARETAREEVDAARAASATLAVATALAMMVGAFVACFAAVFGGRERDGLEDRLVAT